MEKSEPAKRSSGLFMAAVVMKRVRRSGPPKAQQVTFWAGTSMVWAMVPSGAMRMRQRPL